MTNKISAEGKEIIYSTIFFLTITIGLIGYMNWYGQKTMEASLQTYEN